jgi:hypothetical protein
MSVPAQRENGFVSAANRQHGRFSSSIRARCVAARGINSQTRGFASRFADHP